MGLTIFDIDVIAYSHFHPDHTGELVSFLFSSKYPDASQRKKRLTMIGGTGFRVFFEGLKNTYGRWIELPDELFRLVEVTGDRMQRQPFNGFDLISIPVEHNPESVAYRIDSGQHTSVVYSGDTDFCENLIILAHEANLLICEASHPDALKVAGHLSPSLAGAIATKANTDRLILTHLYPESDQADIVAECRKTFAGPILLAEDLLRVTL